VSVKETSVCIVDDAGRIVREADIARRDGYVALCQDRTHAVQQNAWSINSSARSKKIAIDRQT
jgi:hypothetical protein